MQHAAGDNVASWVFLIPVVDPSSFLDEDEDDDSDDRDHGD